MALRVGKINFNALIKIKYLSINLKKKKFLQPTIIRSIFKWGTLI